MLYPFLNFVQYFLILLPIKELLNKISSSANTTHLAISVFVLLTGSLLEGKELRLFKELVGHTTTTNFCKENKDPIPFIFSKIQSILHIQALVN